MRGKKDRKLIVVTALLVFVTFLGLLAWGLFKKQPITGLSGVTMVNRPAPDFTLKTFDGQTISMRIMRGKPVVLNFWASWCPPCRIEAPLLEKAWRYYKKQGVAFIGVDLQDREEDALRFIREFDITYPNAPDPTGEVSISYGVSGLPVTFFVSKEGQILRRWVGALEKEVLIRFIKEIMQ
ncbi:MAG: TlpA family protein disulfide reductase [Deltaproteobacteria bacterium]|nr:TlpA family protein disulfide reductase [Deltaproteobacteria bacterium]MBW1960307.1 TlpA family protein disulfide reductase [Deltaproteobacteria bacterium]MBW2150204.1 TlpA family protein disulfide reductase [Deltaproteobacteria bacterium]